MLMLGKENEIKKLIKITNDYYVNHALTKSEYVIKIFMFTITSKKVC